MGYVRQVETRMRNPTHHDIQLIENEMPPNRDRALSDEYLDFDWAALGPLWDGVPAATDGERHRLAKALHEVFRFICLHGGGMNAIAQRAVALSWVVNPGDDQAATRAARALGCSKATLREQADAARRRLEASR